MEMASQEDDYPLRIVGFKPILGFASPEAVNPDIRAYLRTCGIELVLDPQGRQQVFMQVGAWEGGGWTHANMPVKSLEFKSEMYPDLT